MKRSNRLSFEHNSENLNLTNQLKLFRFRNTYFIPLDWINCLELISVIIFFVLLIILEPALLSLVFLMLLIYLISFVNNRKFRTINTYLSKDKNLDLINNLALRQPNCSTSVDVNGLCMFEYEIPKRVYNGRIKHQNNKETIIIICEENKILVNAYQSKFLTVLVKSNNLKNWIKLMKIKTDSY